MEQDSEQHIEQMLAERRLKLERNIRRSYLIRIFVCSFAFSIATIVLLWKECGLTLSDVLFLQTCFSLVSAAAELPTGYFADCTGRKRSMQFGTVLLCSGAALYCAASSFSVFLAAEVLLAVGFSLASGADEALVHDSLLELGREEEFAGIWGRMGFFTFAGTAIGTAFGAYLSVLWIRLPSYLALMGMCCLVVLVAGLTEPKRDRQQNAPGIGEIFAISRFCFVENRRVRWLILFPPLLFACVQGGFWLYQPYLLDIGFEQAHFGLVYAFFNLVAAAASWFLAKPLIRMSERKLAASCIATVSVSFLLMSVAGNGFGIVCAALHQAVRGAGPIAYSAHLNRLVGSSRRATILSLRSMLGKVIYACILLPLAVYSSGAEVTAMYLALSVGTLAAGFLSMAAIHIE